MRAGIVVALSVTLAGCAVGFPYSYGGQKYTMTKENSDYHDSAITDVRRRFGDPNAQEDVAKLKGACELLQRYAAEAPTPGSFTSARELLDRDAQIACARARHRAEQERVRAENERRRAEQERREEEAHRRRVAEELRRETERQEREREYLTGVLARASKVAETCDATEDARAARRRHEAILRQAPGAIVRKQCTPRMEMRTVKTECTDANGFTRSCTKTVPTNEVAGYTCPKSMDAEVVRLGLYQLDLLDAYPFPEDRTIGVRDEDCEAAHARVRELRDKLGVTSATAEVTP